MYEVANGPLSSGHWVIKTTNKHFIHAGLAKGPKFYLLYEVRRGCKYLQTPYARFVDKIVSSFVRSALRIFVVGMDQTSIMGKKCQWVVSFIHVSICKVDNMIANTFMYVIIT